MVSGSSLLSVDAKQNNNNVKRIKLKERPSDGVLKRRIQNNNKNNDKNNDIKKPPITDQPTIAPTYQPTDHPSNSPSVIQSPAPSMTPTPMPSLSTSQKPSVSTSQKPSLSASLNPSSLKPTTSPSRFPLSTSMPTSSALDFAISRVEAEPVIHYEDSFVYFLFSVLISETYQDSITAEEVTNGNESSLILDLIQTMTHVLCLNTVNLEVITTTNPGRNICHAFQRRRLDDAENAIVSIDLQEALVSVSDKPLLESSYLEFEIRFNIESIGREYQITSTILESEGENESSRTEMAAMVPNTNNDNSIITLFQKKMQKTIDSSIEDGSFSIILQEHEPRVREISSLGIEEEIFSPILEAEFSHYTTYPDGKLVLGRDEYNIPIFHPVRIAGIIMLFLSIIITLTISKLGSRRMEELRLMSLEDQSGMNTKSSSKITRMKLSSEEAVSRMLDVGRGKVVMNDEDSNDHDAMLEYGKKYKMQIPSEGLLMD